VLNTYEAASAVLAGDMPIADLDELECAAIPTVGSCHSRPVPAPEFRSFF